MQKHHGSHAIGSNRHLSTCNWIATLPPSFQTPHNSVYAVSLPACQSTGVCAGSCIIKPCVKAALPFPAVTGRVATRRERGMDSVKRVAERESRREFQPQFLSAWGGQLALPSEEIYLKEKTSHYTPANERAEMGKQSFLPPLFVLQQRQREIIWAFCIVGVLPSQPQGVGWLHIVYLIKCFNAPLDVWRL